MRLTKEFYTQPADKLSALLLGKVICRNINGNILKYKITETECYMGENDTACHAHKGKTKRNEIMFERGGFVYVYLCYGIHYMLNIVSGKKDKPEAVLIRKAVAINGNAAQINCENANCKFQTAQKGCQRCEKRGFLAKRSVLSVRGRDKSSDFCAYHSLFPQSGGPGLVTKALKIDKALNGEDLTVSENLYLEDHGFKPEIFTGKRIGIAYAEEKDRERLWRFFIK